MRGKQHWTGFLYVVGATVTQLHKLSGGELAQIEQLRVVVKALSFWQRQAGMDCSPDTPCWTIYTTVRSQVPTEPSDIDSSLSSQAAMVAIHNAFAKFPDLCNPGVGASAKAGTAVLSGGYNQGTGWNGNANIEHGPVSFGTDGVTATVGEGAGGSVTVNPLKGTVTSVSIFVGVKTKLFEFAANINAAVTGVYQCTQ
jgi:hypothetical protein